VAERTSATTLALGAAVVCGALVAVQARVNGELGKDLHDALLAALVSFGSGLVAVLAVVLARRPARDAWSRVKDVPWWTRLGGIGGASLIAVSAYAAPRIGVALLTVGLVAGQTTGGLLADKVGLGPGGRHPLTAPRVVGAGLCLLAVLVSVVGKGAGSADPLLPALVMASGLLISLQQALNGRVRRVTGDASVATLVNFLIGTAGLTLAYLLFSSGGSAHWPGPDRWWLYTGGVLGAAFVAVAAAIVRTLGVLRLGLATVAGQLVGAIGLDLVAPAAGHGVAGATVVGAVLTFVAVAVSGRPSRSAAVAVAA
jgi:transporter family-2 protein